jgi:hypothetical protein
MEKPPQGVRFEPTYDGFFLRASCLSFTDTVMRVVLAGVVSSLPFKLWWDLIRDFWTYEGASFWFTCLFLSVWAAAIAYADWIALFLYLEKCESGKREAVERFSRVSEDSAGRGV